MQHLRCRLLLHLRLFVLPAVLLNTLFYMPAMPAFAFTMPYYLPAAMACHCAVSALTPLCRLLNGFSIAVSPLDGSALPLVSGTFCRFCAVARVWFGCVFTARHSPLACTDFCNRACLSRCHVSARSFPSRGSLPLHCFHARVVRRCAACACCRTAGYHWVAEPGWLAPVLSRCAQPAAHFSAAPWRLEVSCACAAKTPPSCRCLSSPSRYSPPYSMVPTCSLSL